MDKNDLRKMINMRPKARRNYDADFSESTVIMESGQGEQGGVPIYYAYPTLFPNDPTSKSTTSNPEDWTELKGNEGFKEAQKRGEILQDEPWEMLDIDDGGEQEDMDGEAFRISPGPSLSEAELLRMYEGVNTINIRS